MTIHVIKIKANKYRTVDLRIETTEKSLHLYFDYVPSLVDEVRCMAGAQFEREKVRWRVSNCRRNWIQLEYLQGQIPIEHQVYLNKLPAVDPALVQGLWPHQADMFNHALTRHGVVVAGDMGTGKTRFASTLMDHLKGRWWYVGPNRALDAVRLEFSKWKVQTKPLFLTYGKLRRTVETWTPGAPAPRGIIFDESSRLKNPDSQQTEAAFHLVNAMREEHGAECFVVLMSGTPAPQDPLDWWSQVELACPGWLRESSVYHLRKRMGEFEFVQFGDKSFPKLKQWKPTEVDLLAKRLNGVVHVCRLEDTEIHLPLPRMERVKLPVSDEFGRAAVALLSLSTNALEALTRLRQLSDGFIYSGPDNLPTRSPTPKDGALEDLLERHEEAGRFIVYAGFQESVDRCVEVAVRCGWKVLRCDGRGWSSFKKLKGGVDERHFGGKLEGVKEDLLRMQMAGDPSDKLCFVGHPAAGGMGHNLQGSPAICFYSNDFNNESRQQAERRALRPGMDVRRGLVIYDLLHLGTDEHVLNRLVSKQAIQTTTLAEVRGLFSQ